MRTDQAPAIRLTDYTAPPYLIDTVHLTVRLSPNATHVTSRIEFRPNPDAVRGQALHLDGQKLSLGSIRINGEPLAGDQIAKDAEGLSISHNALPDGPFTWECETEVDPAANTSLNGLYMSNGMYCTQCEAQGFRKITYYPDRPDVMATFTVRIEGDAPVMLSNGNLVTSGAGFVEWHDPWPKPAYLFALVAGNLISHDDSFTTMSGREVDLKIYVRPGDEDKCTYAMGALKRSMTWDEQVYGREYDLDLFMIVAVDDFNMGAMENKGLNIFNTKLVLASPQTATDLDFERIEAVIAHEYFHNWTGNRITCRDWFQLSLKEGLTVFRDQQFTGDMRSHAVKRIDDVLTLRARQFREDAGPLAHPVRPAEYVEINNFYTATVYEKGAEVIRMLHSLVGEDAYRKALDLYFDRHDGQACTIEDWLAVFAETTGRDLTQFKLWYSQSGTPRIAATDGWDGSTYSLTLVQSLAPTPGQPTKAPMLIPVAVGLLGERGQELVPTTVLELSQTSQTFRFEKLGEKPTPSILRGFSAPVILERATDNVDRAFLLAHDTDPFNKWEAGQAYAKDIAAAMCLDPVAMPEPAFLTGMQTMLKDGNLDPAFRALALALPSTQEVFAVVRERAGVADPMVVHQALSRLDTALAEHLGNDLVPAYQALAASGTYSPEAEEAGKRALRGRLLGLITRLDDGAKLAQHQFKTADNMTESLQSLSLLVRSGKGEAALAQFHARWKADRLVIDKWFSVQAMATPPADALRVVTSLTGHPDFDWKNPNRYRALLGAFAISNLAGFHAADGGGYRLLTDWILRLDLVNPQTTARVAGAFETWRQFDEARQALMRDQLQRIADAPNLSKDTGEIVMRILAA